MRSIDTDPFYKRKQTGLGLIGWLIAMPFILICLLILVVLFIEGRKAYWDYKVTQMCEKDGGMKVYETVKLTDEELDLHKNKAGEIIFPLENRASEKTQIIRKNTSTYIRRNNPEIRRDELLIIRKTDNKVLGIRVTYSRVGGGFDMHPSSYMCPEILENAFTAIIAK